MRHNQSRFKTTVSFLWQIIQTGGYILITYSFLPIVGILLLYTVIGPEFITDMVLFTTQIISGLTSIERGRFIAAILAILLFIIGFANQDWQQRRRIVAVLGLLILVAIPAASVFAGQLILPNTELQLVTDAFQSIGSLLLVILTASYVVATRNMHKSNWEMIFDRRKEHYRPIAKRAVTDFIDPLREAFQEQESTLIYAEKGRPGPLPCKADLPEDLIEDIESLGYLKREHERKRGRIKSYDLATISSDARDYQRWQTQYENRYERVFNSIRERIYRATVTEDGLLDLTEEEAQIIQNRINSLTKYLLGMYPVGHHEIEQDPELTKVYPKLDEKRESLLEEDRHHIEFLRETAEMMLTVNEEFITKPNKIADWRGYIMEEYYLAESEV